MDRAMGVSVVLIFFLSVLMEIWCAVRYGLFIGLLVMLPELSSTFASSNSAS
jgi:hypothetical protein